MFLAAYADESYDLPLGVYILTASLVDLTEAEVVRDALYALQSGPHKVHWYKSAERRRADLAKVVQKASFMHNVVIGRGRALKPERARRKCLEALLVELDAMKIDSLLLESRQERNNLLDRQIVSACRRKGLVSQHLHVSFAPGTATPLLWIPDVVCGAVLAAERGNPAYLEMIGDAVHSIEIEVR
ncbi:hypothetical protein INP57_07675 [Saccharopolyspora sp. HNM0986]|uniref:hypothetical protein n=1 Tax=Saccharopolyspora galaxeae TaxID=2781241 RepID=UPI00190D488F|nr:hypothetical protein [Saccharopolyspora sp. HNM0986]MBK0866677.1 hypothetical protein [Saccharopolyspora sp. HNM0986]